ncbi:MAG: hypothetical protein C3F14_11450 [Deltaproteobacteria bacterium]|nr:MAG: hypothetical protein C3F14_11450 [Deltaproteobacteria bacterium]
MYFYSVYRYRSRSERTFARVGSILGYKGYTRGGAYSSLLREAKRLFAAGEEDIILLGPSPIATLARTFSSQAIDDPSTFSSGGEWTDKEETGFDCS